MLGLREEGREIAEGAGYAPREAFLQRARTMPAATESDLTASIMGSISMSCFDGHALFLASRR